MKNYIFPPNTLRTHAQQCPRCVHVQHVSDMNMLGIFGVSMLLRLAIFMVIIKAMNDDDGVVVIAAW